MQNRYLPQWLIIALSVQSSFLPSGNYFSFFIPSWEIIFIYFWLSSRRRQWHPTPALLPGKSHGRRSLVGYSPWGRRGSDKTERLPFHFSLSCIGEGNGNPLQCSSLENPRDGGAWWLPSMGSHRVGHDWSDLATFTFKQHKICTLKLWH